MKNVEMNINEKTEVMTLTIDLKQMFGVSKSGKTEIIASGNQKIPGYADLMLSVNVFKKLL